MDTPTPNKIIIDNQTKRPMTEILYSVAAVMQLGRISLTARGPQYCFVTEITTGFFIYAGRNKKSDRFVAWEAK